MTGAPSLLLLALALPAALADHMTVLGARAELAARYGRRAVARALGVR